MDARDRIRRFVAVSSLAARVYLGYKAITIRQRRFGLSPEEAEARRRAHHRWSAHRLYDLAVRQQGLLIKFGQMLGSRPDLIPDEYVAILSRLQDQVPPRPFPVIERQITRELGRPLADVFSRFDRKPIASASLAQVHRATLKDSRTVAVKVQYPDIWEVVRTDLDSIRFLLRVLAALERNLDFRPIIEEISRNVPLELDFINEGHNAELIAHNFAPRRDIIVPSIHWEHTTRRVLTMEYMAGIKITDFAAMEAAGIDRQAVAKLLVESYARQIFEHGFFHADPHPGNLFVQPGPKLVIVDFGLAKQLPPEFLRGFLRLSAALISSDGAALGQAFRELGFKTKHADDGVFEALGEAMIARLSRNEEFNRDRELLLQFQERMLRIFRENPVVRVPGEFLYIGRVMGLLGGLGKQLGSQVNLLDVLGSQLPPAPAQATP